MRQSEAGGAEAARIGDALREARQALGHSVEEMAAALRIRRPYLEALEEGRLRDLPGLAYAVGFVRSYATALGLDADDMVRRFREASGTVTAKPKLVFPEPVPERGMPAGAVVATGAVVAICAYVAWFNWSGSGTRTVDVVPPVPARLETAAEQGRAQLPATRETAARPDPGALPLAALPPPGGVPAAAQGANTSAQAATVPSAPVPTAAAAVTPAAAPSAPPAVAAPALPGVPEGTRIVLRARASTPEGAWVQVREPRSGQVLVNRVLRPGETWAAPARDGLLLDTGKADGLEILLDGQPQPVLEGLVGVRRNIALDPDRVRQRLSPASAAAATPRN
ncbi:helix-turn-helix domain-containing protein [Falsiroseomonas oryzae]|uniref:helix-turn-helix domain-containing protein n=1 Tax=Falsiroseomonas oryzae TaxID=2766473 RepID=UPI0022EA55BC|nr:helix-turn-helix domain-containing protein [Roseomonas sp. MO-31]